MTTASFPAPLSRLRQHRAIAVLLAFLARPLSAFGVFLILAELFVALCLAQFLPFGPNDMDYSALLDAPGLHHWLGTDELGRDILSRLLDGARLSLSVGVTSVFLATMIGVPLGLVAGYAGGLVDMIFMRILDSIIALPPLVLALTISAVLGAGLLNAMIAIAIVAVPTFARLARGQVLSLRDADYVLAAESVGVPTWLILFRHILPNTISPIMVQASLEIGFAIITESSLSFIGLGAQPPQSTWGSMVQVGFQYLELQPLYALAPASMIFLAVLGFNMVGDGLRQTFQPMAGGSK